MQILSLYTYNFSNKELPTTDTELSAIAADDIHGNKKKPNGLNIPAAIGIPNRLYILANIKFSLILRTVLRDKSKHAITSRRSF